MHNAAPAPAARPPSAAATQAIVAFEQGDQSRAIELIEQLLGGAPAHEADQHFVSALLAFGDGDFAVAREHLHGLEIQMPEVADFVWSLAARAARATGDWAQARANWTLLLHNVPGSPLSLEAWFGIADSYYAEGSMRQAYAAYQAAISMAPYSDRAVIAWYAQARIDEAIGRYREAAQLYGTLVYRRPDDTLNSEASAHLNALIARGYASPPTFAQLLWRIDRLLGLGALDQAQREIEALKAQQNDEHGREEIIYREAQLAHHQQDYDKAAELFATLAAGKPAWARINYDRWLARCYMSADRFDEAAATYQSLAQRLGRRREGRDALFKVAWLAYNNRQPELAVQRFRQFLSAFPYGHLAGEALWYIGWNQFLLGNFSDAAQTMETLRARFPASSLVQRSLYWQGRFLFDLDHIPQAIPLWQQTVSMAPLDYYGLLASDRLEQYRGSGPLVFSDGSTRLAALLEGASKTDVGLPSALDNSLRRDEVETPEATATNAQADAGIFQWNGGTGRRALRLMVLGLHEPAARLMARLPALPGYTSARIAMARAGILHGLGAYFEAYRIVAGTFGEAIDDIPEDISVDYFRMAYPQAHDEYVALAARELGISDDLILAIMRQESNFRTDARSWANARGLMQIIPHTGEKIAAILGVEEYEPAMLLQPAVNIRFGAWYLSRLLENFYGNPVLAIASYNAGPKNVSHWLDVYGGMPTDVFVEQIPFRETRNYVRNVIGNLAVYMRLYRHGTLRVPRLVDAIYLDSLDF